MAFQVSDINIEGYNYLFSPAEIKRELPLSEKAKENVVSKRKEIQEILSGKGSRKILIVGPCSIHNIEEALEYAEKINSLQEKVKGRFLVLMRTYFEKPRTIMGWKGLINDPNLNGSFNIEKGLKIARKLILDINELGVGCATEFLDPTVPQYLSDLVSWTAIGARTTESQTHRELASGLSMPVGFKNTTQGTVKPAINSIKSSSNPHSFLGINPHGKTSIVKTKGNPDCHIILRGGTSGVNYEEESVKEIQEQLEKSQVNKGLIIDCNHGNSNKEFKKQKDIFHNIISQIKRGNDNILGIMIESNLKEGNQELIGNPEELKKGISITDPCLSWEDTEKLILEGYEELKE